MKDWYLKPYFNRRNWILDQVEFLRIDIDELAFLLLIDYANEMKLTLDYEMIERKLHIQRHDVDRLFESLSRKGYLKICSDVDGIYYDLSGLFSEDIAALQQVDFEDLFSIFEQTFNRPLNPSELQKISDFLKLYSNEKIIDALRKADAYRKLNIGYIETILKNENE